MLKVKNLTLRRDDGKGTAILNVSAAVHRDGRWSTDRRSELRLTAIQNVNLDLHEGEVLILCGESGCG